MTHTKHIHDIEGVMLQSVSDPASENEWPTVTSLHVLDEGYKPVGPNLLQLFDKLLMAVPLPNQVLLMEPLLNIVIGELNELNSARVG